MQHRRRKKLIQPFPQLRLMGTLAVAVACGCVLQALLTSHELGMLASDAPDKAVDLGRIRSMIWTSAAAAMIVTVPAGILVMLRSTHRTFGPLYRFKRFLVAVSEEGQVDPCFLRDKDDLKDVCELLNRATEPARIQNARADVAPVDVDVLRRAEAAA